MFLPLLFFCCTCIAINVREYITVLCVSPRYCTVDPMLLPLRNPINKCPEEFLLTLQPICCHVKVIQPTIICSDLKFR